MSKFFLPGVTVLLVGIVVFFFSDRAVLKKWFHSNSKSQAEIEREKILQEHKINFMLFATSRLKDFVSLDRKRRMRRSWYRGKISGKRAYLDSRAGIIWSEPLSHSFKLEDETYWKKARKACEEMKPEGHWSLPTVSEFAVARKNGADIALRDFEGYWVASFADRQNLVFRPDAVSTSKNRKIASAGDLAVDYRIRCVSRIETAPRNGYFQQDIDAHSLAQISRVSEEN